MGDELLQETTSLCAVCKQSIDAEIWQSGARVVMRKRCPHHGLSEVVIAANADWYRGVIACAPVQPQRVHLPVVAITSACDLDCPICYTHNRNDDAYHMGQDDLRAIARHLKRIDPDQRIINLTGGEPTLHPSFERLVDLCHQEGIHRITISTHGLRFIKDESLLERLARIDARIILSFDSLQAPANKTMLGANLLDAKMKVLALLEKHAVNTTLLAVIARGVNEHEVGALLELALAKDFIRSVEIHTMTFTGQRGVEFDRHARIDTYEVLANIERQTGGALRITDFVPSPSAHPLCYLVSYLLRMRDGRWLPFLRFMQATDLRAMLAGALYMEPGPEMEQCLKDVIDRLWAGDIACEETEAVLATLKGLLEKVFAPGLKSHERLRLAESSSKAVYIHAHMDEETFDADRIRQCCVAIQEPDGAPIPSCAYNVLVRGRDARFVRLSRRGASHRPC